MTVNERIYRLSPTLSRPLREEYVFFFFMYLIFVIARYIEEPSSRQSPYVFYLETAGDIYILCTLLSIIPRKIRLWVRLLLYILGYAASFSECFIHERFHLLFGPITVQLLSETTGSETSEFIDAYVKGPVLLRTGLAFLIPALMNIAAECMKGRMNNALRGLFTEREKTAVGLAVPLMLIACIAVTAGQKVKMARFFLSRNTDEAEHCEFSIFHSPIYRLAFSMKFLQLSHGELSHMRYNMRRIRIDSCSHRISTIVLYIGESYNKHHSSLYGYPLSTTPLQDSLRRSGSLIAFGDVVTPWNVTSNVFKDILSTHSTDEPGSWTDGVLLPGVMKKAGYMVAFITSQYYKSPNLGTVDFNGSFFLNDSEIGKECFDFRNKYRRNYDLSLLSEIGKIPPAPFRFIIFHGMGQHQEYRKRFTDKDIRFTVGSYASRHDLSLKEKQLVADYDNATLYNDRVVSALCRRFRNDDAVVVYLPDHGEEVYDRIHSYGRDHNAAISPDLAWAEFEVPFEIWFSPRAMKKHRDLYLTARAHRDLPFSSDDLPHVIMGLSGIHSPLYKPHRDILSPAFRPGRKRILKGTTDYDSLMSRRAKNLRI